MSNSATAAVLSNRRWHACHCVTHKAEVASGCARRSIEQLVGTRCLAVAGQWFYGSFPCGNSVPSRCSVLRVTDRAFQSRVCHCGTCLRAKSHRTQLAMSCCAQRVAPCTRRPPAAHCEPARRSCRERGATAVLATNATPHTHTPRRVTQTAACTSHASHQATAVAEQKRIHKTRRSRGCLSQP